MKRIEFHPEAEGEFARIVEFYGRQRPQLAVEFADVVEEAIAFVRSNPGAGTPVRGVTTLARAALSVQRDRSGGGAEMYVLALAHHRQRPGYRGKRK